MKTFGSAFGKIGRYGTRYTPFFHFGIVSDVCLWKVTTLDKKNLYAQ